MKHYLRQLKVIEVVKGLQIDNNRRANKSNRTCKNLNSNIGELPTSQLDTLHRDRLKPISVYLV